VWPSRKNQLQRHLESRRVRAPANQDWNERAIARRFGDVPLYRASVQPVEAAAWNGLSEQMRTLAGGCSGEQVCSDLATQREEMSAQRARKPGQARWGDLASVGLVLGQVA